MAGRLNLRIFWWSAFGIVLAIGYVVALMAIAKSLPKGRPRYTLHQLFIVMTAITLVLGFIAWYTRK